VQELETQQMNIAIFLKVSENFVLENFTIAVIFTHTKLKVDLSILLAMASTGQCVRKLKIRDFERQIKVNP
jgi:hypothetical protein